MHTYLNTLIHKAFYGAVILAVLLSAFGGTNLKSAHAQGNTQETLPTVTVSLSADKTLFGAAEEIILHVTVTNNGSETVKLLNWFTPFSDHAEPLLNVSVDGVPAAFTGATYKRTLPTEQDYVSLDAGASMTGNINLGSLYNLSVSGNYEATYSVTSDSLFWDQNNAAVVAGSLSSSTLAMYIEGRDAPQPVPPDGQILAAAGANTFVGCTTSEQSALTSSRASAYTYATDSVTYLSNGQSGARYTTWFGLYNSTRYSTVKTHFVNLKSVTDTAAITFDCTDDSAGIYAYVYPDQPYKIWLCGAFWSAPVTGTDSKAGTLLHEISHFAVIAGTDDYVYGQSGAKSLAINNPAQAIMNADNHEYFAENTPSLETTNTATYTISGNAGVAGATLSYIDGTAKTATADINGIYTFMVSSGWSGAVTPSKSGYTFTPTSKTYSNVTFNQTAQNYAAAVVVTSYTISGNAGVAGATFSYTDGTAKTATADINGNYTFTVSSGWSGTVTPSKSGYTFTPTSKSYSNVTFNQSEQNYVAMLPTTQTAVFSSYGANDGWVLEYSETAVRGGSMNSSATYFILGDDAADRQYRTILHFNTAALPDKVVITSAKLMINKQSVAGTTPFSTHGNLLADIRKLYLGTTASLQIADFQSAASLQNAASFDPTPTEDNWYSAPLGSSSYTYFNLTGTTQFRLRFALDDNDDRSADYIKFFSGNYSVASLRPQLVVQYYVP